MVFARPTCGFVGCCHCDLDWGRRSGHQLAYLQDDRLGEHYEPCDKRIAALRSPSRRLNAPRGFLDGRAIIAKPIDQFLGLVTAYARSHCQGLNGHSVRAGDLASFRKSIVYGKGSAASRSISALAWCQCRS